MTRMGYWVLSMLWLSATCGYAADPPQRGLVSCRKFNSNGDLVKTYLRTRFCSQFLEENFGSRNAKTGDRAGRAIFNDDGGLRVNGEPADGGVIQYEQQSIPAPECWDQNPNSTDKEYGNLVCDRTDTPGPDGTCGEDVDCSHGCNELDCVKRYASVHVGVSTSSSPIRIPRCPGTPSAEEQYGDPLAIQGGGKYLVEAILEMSSADGMAHKVECRLLANACAADADCVGGACDANLDAGSCVQDKKSPTIGASDDERVVSLDSIVQVTPPGTSVRIRCRAEPVAGNCAAEGARPVVAVRKARIKATLVN